MAYQEPIFWHEHDARIAGAGVWTSSETADADFPVARLSDGLGNSMFKTAASHTTLNIDLDREANGARSLFAIDRLIIPTGHNLHLADDIEILSDDNAGFSSATSRHTFSPLTSNLINETFAAFNERYVRLTIDATIAGAQVWQIGELYYSRDTTLTGGIVPAWQLAQEPNISTFETQSGGFFTRINGAAPWRLRMEYRFLPALDDIQMLLILGSISNGALSFYIQSPDTTVPTLLVRLDRPVLREQQHPIPASGPRYGYRFDLLEMVL